MTDIEDVLEGLIQELRRGTLVLGVLSQLVAPKYGYALVQTLTEKGFAVDAGTLYPLLRRLEKQDLLISSWEIIEARPRRYYQLSEQGRTAYPRLLEQWRAMMESMNRLIEGV